MHRPWLPLLLAAVSAWPALPAHANHESASTILNQFRALSPRLHVLKPAPAVRALPVSTDEAARLRINADAQAMVAKNFSVVVIDKGELLAEAYGHGATAESALNS